MNTRILKTKQIEEENSKLIKEILTGLNEWLIKHILKSDKRFVTFYYGKQKN